MKLPPKNVRVNCLSVLGILLLFVFQQFIFYYNLYYLKEVNFLIYNLIWDFSIVLYILFGLILRKCSSVRYAVVWFMYSVTVVFKMAVFAFNTNDTATGGFTYESEDTLLTFFGLYVTPIVYSLFNRASKYPLFPDDSVNISVDEFLHSDLGLSTTIDLWDVVLMFSHLTKCKKDLLSGLLSRTFVLTFLIMSLANIFLLGLTFPTAEGDTQQFFDINANFMRIKGDDKLTKYDGKSIARSYAHSSFDVDKRTHTESSGNVDINPFRSSLDMFTIAKYAFVIGFFLIDLPYLCYRIYLLYHSNIFSLLLYKNVLFLFLRPYRLNMNQLAERDTAKGWQTAFFEAETTSLKMETEVSPDPSEGEYLKKFTRRYTLKRRQTMQRASTFLKRMGSTKPYGPAERRSSDRREDGEYSVGGRAGDQSEDGLPAEQSEDDHYGRLEGAHSLSTENDQEGVRRTSLDGRHYAPSGAMNDHSTLEESPEVTMNEKGGTSRFSVESTDNDGYYYDLEDDDDDIEMCDVEDMPESVDLCKTFILQILRKTQKLPVKSFPMAIVTEYCKKSWHKQKNSTKQYGISSMENVQIFGYSRTLLYRYYSSIFFTLLPRIFIVVFVFSYPGEIRPPRTFIGEKLASTNFVEMLPYYIILISSFMIPFSFYSTCGFLDLAFAFVRDVFSLLSLITCVCAFKSSLPKGYQVIHCLTSLIFLVYPLNLIRDFYWSVYRHRNEGISDCKEDGEYSVGGRTSDHRRQPEGDSDRREDRRLDERPEGAKRASMDGSSTTPEVTMDDHYAPKGVMGRKGSRRTSMGGLTNDDSQDESSDQEGIGMENGQDVVMERKRAFLYRLEFFFCKYSMSPIAVNFRLLSADLMECVITTDILIHSQWSYLIYTFIFRLFCCSITSSKVSITIVLIDLLLGLAYTTISQALRALILRGQEITHIIATSQDKSLDGYRRDNVSLGEVDKYIKVQGLLSSPGIIVPAFL